MDNNSLIAIREFDIIEDEMLGFITGGANSNGIDTQCSNNTCTGNTGTCEINHCIGNTEDCVSNNCNSNRPSPRPPRPCNPGSTGNMN